MYKCLECGHIFEPGEEAEWVEKHGFTDGRYEKSTGCPLCKSAYEETVPCKECLGAFLSDELFPGRICRECLIKQITIENTKSYILWADLEKEFYFEFFMNSQVLRYSPRLLQIVKDTFSQYANSHPIETIAMCKSYVAMDDEGLTDFAEFLEKKK